ncbi:glycosyltransferase [Methylobacterium sp. E-016]|uniref:glycosyltransferase n=1 Tax=Methylobacterium sp. E-016 TaxID=2836556 RepID=UPI001FBC1380|nr:glycosyltransferase [Methylobacterium sp. E-016]MCJ2077093.1 glycosyltransferase [Methylobacterium sp. E-016]
MATIGLSIIVRDEAHVVLRCLESASDLIDAAVVVDTGSRDGTPDLVRTWLARHGIPGCVITEPWRDFAHNRSSALAALRRRPGIDYTLVLDADDRLVRDAGFDPAAFKAALAADVDDVEIRHGGTVYRRLQLFANRLDFRYRSVLHEYLTVPDSARTRAFAAGLAVHYGGDGARSRDPETYARDAALLEAALVEEADPGLRALHVLPRAELSGLRPGRTRDRRLSPARGPRSLGPGGVRVPAQCRPADGGAGGTDGGGARAVRARDSGGAGARRGPPRRRPRLP